MNMIKIFALNRHYLPGYRAGGPIRTLANMVARFGNEFDFHIVTLDRDFGENASPYEGVAPGCWVHVGKARVMYLEKAKLSIRNLAQIVTNVNPDVIYLNSFFDPTFTQRLLWARRLGLIRKIPVILAPRGEFSEGALRLKRLKKLIFLGASRLIGLYDDITWQSSSNIEFKDILRNLAYVKKHNIHIAKNLSSLEDKLPMCQFRDDIDQLCVCFLSRISPMKNIDFALQVMNEVSASIVFNIYGPKEDLSYWAECEQLIARLQKNVSVVYRGSVHPDDVKQTMSENDLFFLPTRGENYGHVIHEALSAGLPVLISDQTPWNEVTERGVGWALPLDNPSEFARIIDEVASWDPERHARTRQCAIEFAKEKSVANDVLQANRDLFIEAVSRGQL